MRVLYKCSKSNEKRILEKLTRGDQNVVEKW